MKQMIRIMLAAILLACCAVPVAILMKPNDGNKAPTRRPSVTQSAPDVNFTDRDDTIIDELSLKKIQYDRRQQTLSDTLAEELLGVLRSKIVLTPVPGKFAIRSDVKMSTDEFPATHHRYLVSVPASPKTMVRFLPWMNDETMAKPIAEAALPPGVHELDILSTQDDTWGGGPRTLVVQVDGKVIMRIKSDDVIDEEDKHFSWNGTTIRRQQDQLPDKPLEVFSWRDGNKREGIAFTIQSAPNSYRPLTQASDEFEPESALESTQSSSDEIRRAFSPPSNKSLDAVVESFNTNQLRTQLEDCLNEFYTEGTFLLVTDTSNPYGMNDQYMISPDAQQRLIVRAFFYDKDKKPDGGPFQFEVSVPDGELCRLKMKVEESSPLGYAVICNLNGETFMNLPIELGPQADEPLSTYSLAGNLVLDPPNTISFNGSSTAIKPSDELREQINEGRWICLRECTFNLDRTSDHPFDGRTLVVEVFLSTKSEIRLAPHLREHASRFADLKWDESTLTYKVMGMLDEEKVEKSGDAIHDAVSSP